MLGTAFTGVGDRSATRLGPPHLSQRLKWPPARLSDGGYIAI